MPKGMRRRVIRRAEKSWSARAEIQDGFQTHHHRQWGPYCVVAEIRGETRGQIGGRTDRRADPVEDEIGGMRNTECITLSTC